MAASQTSTEITQGDFSTLAKSYVHRPGYSIAVLRMLGTLVTGGEVGRPVVVDIGAGTGKLTLDLSESGYPCTWAVEPNDAMRAEGMAATTGKSVTWKKGRAEETTLEAGCADWALMGSSLHWTDLPRALAEFRRVLRPGGWFTAIWNPRHIEKSALHQRIERRIQEIVPDLKRVSSGAGAYATDMPTKLTSTGMFTDVVSLEAEYTLQFPRERYLGAWRSVNDIQAQAGPDRFQTILAAIEEELGSATTVDVPYRTRSWSAKRI